MLTLKHLFALSFILIAQACTTAAVRLAPEESSNEPWSGQGILLSYESDEAGCELTLRNLADDLEYVLPLAKGKQTLLVSAPKGGYRGEQLSCKGYRRWSLNRFLRDAVELVPGKINYIGHVHFDLDDTGKDLSVLFGDRRKNTEGLGRAFQSLPAAWKKLVVSAATTKPLRESMTALNTDPGTEWDERLRIRVKRYLPSDRAGEEARPLTELQKSLAQCDQEEQSRYTLRVGRLTRKATYQGKKLTGIERSTDDHAFSDELDHCFEDAFQRYAPPTDEKIEVTIEL